MTVERSSPQFSFIRSLLGAPFYSNPAGLVQGLDGSLGYIVDGQFCPMYGPPKTEREVGSVSMSYEEGIERGFEVYGLNLQVFRTRGRTFKLDNVLFMCDSWEDPDGPMFVRQPWPRRDDPLTIRALYPEALRGGGAMVRSNQHMVYVIDASLPIYAKKGYLAVDGPEMVRR